MSGLALGCVLGSNPSQDWGAYFHSYLHESNHAEQDWKSLRLYFGWQSEQVIQDTYKVTSGLEVLFLIMIT